MAPRLRHSDDAVSARLLDADDSFGPEDAVVMALSTAYHRAVGMADSALLLGDREVFGLALTALEAVVANAASIGNIPTWWVSTLTIHIVRDLWSQSLHTMLPPRPSDRRHPSAGAHSAATLSRCWEPDARRKWNFGLRS